MHWIDSDSIDAGRLLERLRVRWIHLFAGLLLGGVIGYLATGLLPPRYQAVAVIGVGIDYGRTLPVDRDAEAALSERVRALLLSDEVILQVMERVDRTLEHPPSEEAVVRFRDSLKLSERETIWTLTTESESADTARSRIDAWVEIGLDEIEQAIEHAWRTTELQAGIYELGCSFVLDGDTGLSVWRCHTEGTEMKYEGLIDSVIEEAEKSKGLLPGMTTSLLQSARSSGEPILWGRGTLILSGLGLGIVIGLLYIIFAVRDEG